MTLTKKITAWTVAMFLAIPAIMVFNDNYDTVYYNFIGLAYCWLIAKIHRYILPQWMVDYFHEDIDLDDEFED